MLPSSHPDWQMKFRNGEEKRDFVWRLRNSGGSALWPIWAMMMEGDGERAILVNLRLSGCCREPQ